MSLQSTLTVQNYTKALSIFRDILPFDCFPFSPIFYIRALHRYKYLCPHPQKCRAFTGYTNISIEFYPRIEVLLPADCRYFQIYILTADIYIQYNFIFHIKYVYAIYLSLFSL